MKQHLCALLCLIVCMILTAASAGALITLPKHLTAIGESAFSGIRESIALVIPDGVTEIPARAFSGTKIHSVVFPAKMLPAGADGNGDRVIILQELHQYIQSVGDGRVQDEYLHYKMHELIREYQKTQVYPEEVDIPLFRKKETGG